MLPEQIRRGGGHGSRDAGTTHLVSRIVLPCVIVAIVAMLTCETAAAARTAARNESRSSSSRSYRSESPTSRDDRRVFYNIAHMVNSIKEVDEFLERKANAFETDVSFSADGTPSTTYHGFPCDCLRECGGKANITEFLDYVRRKVDTNATLTLLLLDLKVSGLENKAKIAAGRQIVSMLARHLWDKAHYRLNVLLYIPRTQDHQVIEGALAELSSPWMQQFVLNVGFDVSTAKELSKVQDVFDQYGLNERIWQGDGITNCVSTLRSSKDLKNALTLRDLGGHAHKVYQWTVDLTAYQSAALDLGVDGMITNVPERLDTLIRGKFAKTYRLATRNDNPWERHAAFDAPETTRAPITSVASNLKEIGEQKVKFATDKIKGILG